MIGRDYGLTLVAPQAFSADSKASAQDVARPIHEIRERGTPAVFVENVVDARLLSHIVDETGAGVGDMLYPNPLSRPDGPARTYHNMMQHNAMTLVQALAS